MACCKQNSCTVRYQKSYDLPTITNPTQYLNNIRDTNNLYVYSPTPMLASDTDDDGYVETENGYGLYNYINLIDLVKEGQKVVFDKIRMFLNDIATVTPNVNVSVAIYKLGPGATFNDSSTYPANSSIFASADILNVTESGFFDLSFSSTIELTPFDGGIENHYFFGIAVLGANSGLLQGNARYETPNLTYRTALTISTELDSVLPVSVDVWWQPYYTLFKS